MEQLKIGVYVCDCGINIAATVNVPEVVEFASGLPGVVVAREHKYTCSDPGQKLIKEDVRTLGLNRVVVASCSPRMHEPTFQNAVASEGLNPYYFAMANIASTWLGWCLTPRKPRRRPSAWSAPPCCAWRYRTRSSRARSR